MLESGVRLLAVLLRAASTVFLSFRIVVIAEPIIDTVIIYPHGSVAPYIPLGTLLALTKVAVTHLGVLIEVLQRFGFPALEATLHCAILKRHIFE
jgi:hypothetical protein